MDGEGQEGSRSDRLVPCQLCPGPAVAVASPVRLCERVKENGSGKALEKWDRRGHAGPGCVGPEVEVAEVAETGLPTQRKKPWPSSLSERSLGSARLSESMWACNLWVMGAGSLLVTL